MLYNNLIEIKKDLSYRHRDREKLNIYYVNERLNKSLITYYEDISRSVKYLNDRKPENVIKKL